MLNNKQGDHGVDGGKGKEMVIERHKQGLDMNDNSTHKPYFHNNTQSPNIQQFQNLQTQQYHTCKENHENNNATTAPAQKQPTQIKQKPVVIP